MCDNNQKYYGGCGGSPRKLDRQQDKQKSTQPSRTTHLQTQSTHLRRRNSSHQQAFEECGRFPPPSSIDNKTEQKTHQPSRGKGNSKRKTKRQTTGVEATQTAGPSRATAVTGPTRAANNTGTAMFQKTEAGKTIHPVVGTQVTVPVGYATCPVGYAWVKVQGGYRCWAGACWISEGQMEQWQEHIALRGTPQGNRSGK